MHSYSIDLPERKYIPKILIVIGIFTTGLLHQILEKISIPYIPPYFISIPSAFMSYGLYMWFFENHLWKKPFFRNIFSVKTPDLNGTWAGHLKSSYDGHSKEYKCNLIISQTWNQINMCLKTETSSSKSFAASINFFSQSEGTLIYEYANEPKSSAPSDMNSHIGTAILSFKEADKKLEGYYYSGRGRLRHGELFLKKSKT